MLLLPRVCFNWGGGYSLVFSACYENLARHFLDYGLFFPVSPFCVTFTFCVCQHVSTMNVMDKSTLSPQKRFDFHTGVPFLDLQRKEQYLPLWCMTQVAAIMCVKKVGWWVCTISLCVACHCVMHIYIWVLAVSSWLHSSDQAKASGVFSFLQNGIIWQLFIFQGTDCRGQLFMPPDHIKHWPFVFLMFSSPRWCFIPNFNSWVWGPFFKFWNLNRAEIRTNTCAFWSSVFV